MDGIIIAFIHTLLGIGAFPKELQSLSLRFLSLQVVVSGIYLSYSWISLYYLSVLDSFNTFSIVVAIGMLAGAFLDVPLGFLTDRKGQRMAFCGALFSLMLYYFGLIFASFPIQFVFLEVLVGIYSALISGSFISWFLNSWETLAPQSSDSGLLFRNIMGNISFAKSIFTAFATFLGGILLQQFGILPKYLFLMQALIAGLGVILGLKFISNPRIKGEMNEKQKNNIQSEEDISRFSSVLGNLSKHYLLILPYFISFSILGFTSVSFNTIIFSPLVYEIYSSNQTFNQNDFIIQFTTISLLFITITISISNVIFALFSRLSGKLTASIKSAYKGILIFYTLDYPIVFTAYLFVLHADLLPTIKITLVILIFFFKIILGGLATSLYWQLYYQITCFKQRSSQESLYNTINLIISLIGFGIIGVILESYGFVEALFFLFLLSSLGILTLIIAKIPNRILLKKPLH